MDSESRKGKYWKLWRKSKPFLAVVFLQFGLAGMDIIAKAALNKGMSNFVFVVYRHAVATIVIGPFALVLDKKRRPKMTLPILGKLLLLGLLEPVIDQNLYIMGMKYTTATFAAAMWNVLPAITFLMAYIFRLEKIKIRSIRSQAKIAGTVITLGGAMVMTLVKGPIIEVLWNKGSVYHGGNTGGGGVDLHSSIKGFLMITIGCISSAGFMVLQAITLQTYPAELSLTAWICLFGMVEGAVVALVMERGNYSVWAIRLDTKFLAALYTGIVCSGLAYYIQGLIMKERGPVFVTAFSPLGMIIVVIMGSIILGEQLFVGRLVGAFVIVCGLYMVVWGKIKDYKSLSESIIDSERGDNNMHHEEDQAPPSIARSGERHTAALLS